MQITVEGFNKKVTQELREAAEFFAYQLMDSRMVRNLTLDIEKYRDLEDPGEVVNEDGTYRSRWFTINIRASKEDEDPVKTLAHEMVHVKQYAKRELRKSICVGKGLRQRRAVVWQGEPWLPKRNEDAYWDAPWEIEAYGREVGLYHKWVQHYNTKKKSTV